MKKFIYISLLTLSLTGCSENTNQDSKQPETIEDPQYNKALLKIAQIDSINAALEWEEDLPGLWVSNKGQYGIQENRMIYMDSMLFVTDYITKIDSTPIIQVINRPTFEYLGNNFYRDAYHVYHYYPMAYGGAFNILDTADRESFRVMGDCYAQDVHFVYSEKGEILDGIDYNSFYTTRGAGCFAKDKYGYYFWGDRIDESNADSTALQYINILETTFNNMDTLFTGGNQSWSSSSDESTLIELENYNLILEGLFDYNQTDQDTLTIYEDLGEYLVGRELKIIPKNEKDTFHLFVQSIDRVYELMESDSAGIIGDWQTFDPIGFADTSDLFYWKTNFKNKYIFPDIGYINGQLMSTRVKDFGFRDTTYWYHGEMSGTYLGKAWLYQGHIVDYWIYTAFVKIERHNNGLLDTKWLKLEFSYGC